MLSVLMVFMVSLVFSSKKKISSSYVRFYWFLRCFEFLGCMSQGYQVLSVLMVFKVFLSFWAVRAKGTRFYQFLWFLGCLHRICPLGRLVPKKKFMTKIVKF